MTLDEIKAAVDRGETVCWSHDGYVVEKWQPTQLHPEGTYEIVYLRNRHAIGLTWLDGVTMNGRPEDFYVKGTR